MKANYFTILCLLLSIGLCGQYSPPTMELSESLRGGTLEVVLTGDERFDSALKKMIEEELTICQVKYVSTSDFEGSHENKDEVLALLVSKGDFSVTVGTSLLVDLSNYQFFGIIDKYLEKEGKYRPRDSVHAYSLSVPSGTDIELEIAMRYILRGFNNDAFKYSDKKARQSLVGKKLVLLDTQFENDAKVLGSFYPGDVELVTEDRLNEILKKQEDVIIGLKHNKFTVPTLETLGRTYCVSFYTFINCTDGKLVHYAKDARPEFKKAKKNVKFDLYREKYIFKRFKKM